MSEREQVESRDKYKTGRQCCRYIPVLETLDTQVKFEARYRFRVYCPKCLATTTKCTNAPDAKRLWDNSDLEPRCLP